MRSTWLVALVAGFVLLLPAAGASAAGSSLSDTVNQWFPSSDGATWTYQWSDDTYAPAPTTEKYTMVKRTSTAFTLDWTTADLGNGDDAQSGQGEMGFNRADAGLINTGWSSTPPPPQFPILCANPTNCGNSLSGALFMVIWGTRGPVLQEPLLKGASWNAVGGANNDVASENHYLGTEEIVVPAFPGGVIAAKVRSEVTQAGAIGDPYGSGERTVWWVRGVGPVRVLFRHTGGESGYVDLVGTNLLPQQPPGDANYLPLDTGSTATYRWRNSKYMRKYSTQKATVAQVVNNTARVDVKSTKGPIKVAGSYVFSTRLSGVTDLAASTKAASLAKFPPLGPRSQPKSKRRHFFTPLDLMTYGYNPVISAYPVKGDTWKSKAGSRDFTVFGVDGSSTVLGIQKVHTPAGNFNALAVRSRLTQKGFKFGSGTRTSWFAPGKGLVKLVFRHGDGSVSTVDRVR
jgi:hypothetical protein